MKRNPSCLLLAWLVLTLVLMTVDRAEAQKKRLRKLKTSMDGRPYIFFPHPMEERKWRMAVGLVFTTSPREITEEIRLSVPAADFQVLRKLPKNFYLTGRVNFQLVQNQVLVGARWAYPLTKKLSVAVGDDLGFWFGFLSLEGFNNSGNGLINYPNVSVGYKLADDLLFTFKTEAILDLRYRSSVGTNVISSNPNTVSGAAFSFILEQPFFKQQHFSLGFRLLYTDFNWQFWSLYPTFDRKIVYPQLIFSFII